MYRINSIHSELEDMGKEIMELKEKCAELNRQSIESLVDEKIEKFSEEISQGFKTLKDDDTNTNTLSAIASSIFGSIASISNNIYNRIRKVFSRFMPKRITHKKS